MSDLSKDFDGLHGVVVPSWLLRKRLPDLLAHAERDRDALLVVGAELYRRNTKRLAEKAERLG